MVSDTEPRFRLVDGDGTVVGTLFAESDGTLKLQEGSSGNDNELSFTTQGALEVEQASVSTAPSADNDVLRRQEGVEVGSLTFAGPSSQPADATWGTSVGKSLSVSFSTAFDAVPTVVISASAEGIGVASPSIHGDVYITDTTQSGFSFTFAQFSTNDLSSTELKVTYVASRNR